MKLLERYGLSAVVCLALLSFTPPPPTAVAGEAKAKEAADPAPRNKSAATKKKTATARDEERVLFTFAIFGDNKIGGPRLDRVFGDLQKIKPSFVIGMGDHYQLKGSLEAFDESIRKAFGHERFWPVPGDNEDQYWGGKQTAFGAQKPYFVRLGLFDKAGKPRRREIVASNPEMFDYYARFTVNGLRLHLVVLYKQDSMSMQKSTRKFADRILPEIRKKYPAEPLIVAAHDGRWWTAYFRPGHAIYSCDLLMGASWHVYSFFGAQGQGTNLAFNTSALFRGARSWYAVLVLRDKFVLLNISDAKFAVKGRPGCHIKPFGKRGRVGDPQVWFKRLKEYAAGVKEDWGPLPQSDLSAATPGKTPGNGKTTGKTGGKAGDKAGGKQKAGGRNTP